MIKNIYKVFIFVAIVYFVQFIGSFAMRYSDPNWYKTLSKPVFTPPDYVFGIVWPILYLMIAVAGFLIWKNLNHRFGNLAIIFWGCQLFFNMIWTFLFFYMHEMFLALVDIFLIWCFTILCMIFAYSVTVWGFVLLIPYILWITFAFVLNLYFYLFNR